MFVTGFLNKLIFGGKYVKIINDISKIISNIDILFLNGNPKINNFEEINSPMKSDIKNILIFIMEILYPIIPV